MRRLGEGWRLLQDRTWGLLPSPVRPLIWMALALSVIVMPHFGEDTWLRMFFLVALYATLGMGLNVVVGMAGLLDLGFVAFFATGAYTVGILGSPVSPHETTLNYWFLFPLALGLGALFGLLLGLPVLPLRGDYLAIVTLGFGEIIRILVLNMSDQTRGSSGLFQIRKPDVPLPANLRDLLHLPVMIDDIRAFYVLALVAALVVWFATSRLRDSRVGRAWEAIREDEDVAAGMGINTTRYKLMAFATGAAIGAVGGAIFAPYIDFVAPQSFSLQVSINVLAVVIIGGMGSTTGVIAGSVILIGVPELLQFQETADLLAKLAWLRDILNPLIHAFNTVTFLHVSDLPPANEWGDKLALYRFIVFGLLLVVVMVLRPMGIFPSRRRELEFENPPEAELATSEGVA